MFWFGMIVGVAGLVALGWLAHKTGFLVISVKLPTVTVK